MKVTIFVSACLALLALGWAESVNDEGPFLDNLLIRGEPLRERQANNYIDTILKRLVERIRQAIAKKEPYPVPNLPEQKIHDKNVQITIKVTKMKENHGSSLKVNNLNNHIFRMSEDFDVTVPKLDFTGDYTVKGKILGKKVHGNGKFLVKTTDVHVWGTAYAHLVHGSVQLKKLPVNYTVKSVTASVTGLKVQGLSQKKVNNLLSKSLEKYFTKNEKLVSDTASKSVLAEVNTLLKGKSLKQLINWLRHYEPQAL